jgi:competence protein ComEC
VKPSVSEQISTSALIWISVALLGGIVLASILVLPILVWFLLAFIGLIAALILRRLRPQLTFGILLLPGFLFLGAARYQMAQPFFNSTFISYYNDLDRKVYITGSLTEPPDVRDTYLNLHLRVEAVDTGEGDLPVRGDLLVRLGNEYEVHYGDRVRVRGYLQTPPETEEFSYRDYLALQGIHSILRTDNITILPGTFSDPFHNLMYRLQSSLFKRIYWLFPEPEASLLAGVLLGADKNIPAEVQQAFKDTGTAHIIAISGFNIAILAAVFILIFSKIFGRYWGALFAILGIAAYTILVGASASVVRAAIMGSLSVIAGLFGRRNLALTALAASASVMALFNPMVLWDIGFQLSFAATIGLVLYAQPMQDAVSAFLSRYFPPENVDKFIGPFSSYVLLTFAAQLTTLPITLYHFGRFSLVSFIANPVILPAQPALMVLGGLAVTVSKIYLPLGELVAWVALPFATFTIRMVEFFDKFPGAVLTLGEFSLLAAIFFYLILFSITFAWPRVKGFAAPAVVFSAMAVLTILTWRSVLNMPDGRLHVLFLDVGSADGILITTPSGRFVLINGGPSPSILADQLGRRISPFNRGIDYLVVASTQENQVAALPRVMEQYHPKSVLWSGNPQASFSSQRFKEWVTTTAVPLELAEVDHSYDLGDGVTLRILASSSRGAVLSIEMGNFKTILPVGVTFDIFKELKNGQGLGPTTALLISESGYAPSNPPDWIANLKPQLAILSVAAGDPNGLPSKDVISTLEGSNLIRTDKYGWVDLASNGTQLWVTSERKPAPDKITTKTP